MKDLFSPRIPDFIYIYGFPEVTLASILMCLPALEFRLLNLLIVLLFFVFVFLTPTTRIHSPHSNVCVVLLFFVRNGGQQGHMLNFNCIYIFSPLWGGGRTTGAKQCLNQVNVRQFFKTLPLSLCLLRVGLLGNLQLRQIERHLNVDLYASVSRSVVPLHLPQWGSCDECAPAKPC